MYLGPPKDIRDMEIFLGVVERCPNLARAHNEQFDDEDSLRIGSISQSEPSGVPMTIASSSLVDLLLMNIGTLTLLQSLEI